jgi:hypothetical protein
MEFISIVSGLKFSSLVEAKIKPSAAITLKGTSITVVIYNPFSLTVSTNNEQKNNVSFSIKAIKTIYHNNCI